MNGSFVGETRADDRSFSAASKIVDARGHRCPAPTLRLQRALRDVAPGQTVELLADDPMARIDVPHFVREAGHTLVEHREDGPTLAFVVARRGGSSPDAGPRSG